MAEMKISYKDFKTRCFDQLSTKDKNTLFYWSLMDSSSWEESPPSYYPDDNERLKAVKSILKKFPRLSKYVNHKNFVKEFIDQEFLTNYILAAAIENKTQEKWKPDISNLEKAIFPDVRLKNNPRSPTEIEIKGMLSSLNLKDRIENEIVPNLKDDGHKYFLLLLLFPLCSNDDPDRISHLIDGYYVYETILGSSKTRKVLCQCVSLDNKNKKYILDNLVERIFEGYFKKLELLD